MLYITTKSLQRHYTSYSLIHTIKEYSKRKVKPINLKTLLENSNFTTNNNKILRTQYLYKELPIRLSHRIMELNELPYNLLKLKSMQNVYNQYIDSFKNLTDSKYPENIFQSEEYSNVLSNMLTHHQNINHDIANSLITFNKKNKMNSNLERNINVILNRFYTSRLSIRFLTYQHLEIKKSNNSYIGIINKKCNPYNIIEDCIADIKLMSEITYHKLPIINFENDINKNIKIIYIDSHIRYIVTEILKNSLRAAMENNLHFNPISINIQCGKEDLIIKISDKSGGFNRKILDKVFNFTFTTGNIEDYMNHQNKSVIISGYGHGLGLSRIYSRYFGGELKIIPFEGVGTDVYIYLNRLGNKEENVSDQYF